jgi:uncharacterized membrane protein (UPF0127 family)
MMNSPLVRKKSVFKIAIVLAGLILAGGCDLIARIPAVQIHTQKGGVVSVEVEVARKPAERTLGLMFKKSLGKNKGMLFIFEKENKQTFVMKNTFIPLDMIFIGSDMRVAGWVENARPLSTEQFSIARPAQYVLEVHALFCRDNGIAIGDEVTFKNID